MMASSGRHVALGGLLRRSFFLRRRLVVVVSGRQHPTRTLASSGRRRGKDDDEKDDDDEEKRNQIGGGAMTVLASLKRARGASSTTRVRPRSVVGSPRVLSSFSRPDCSAAAAKNESTTGAKGGEEEEEEKTKTKKKTTVSAIESNRTKTVEVPSKEQREMDREAEKFASSWAKELAKVSAESMEQLELTKTVSDHTTEEEEEEEEEKEKKVPEDDQKTRRRRTRRDWGTIPQELLPKVAVVGRPNVGKSALFNRLTGTKRAIVFDEPGVTRDRMYVRAFWGDHEFMLVDTGGLESLPGDPNAAPSIDRIGGVEILPGMIEAQAAEAVREADVLIFVTDGQSGLTAADKEIFRWLRKHHADIPVHLAVNKCESSTRGEEMVLDFWQLSSKNVAPIGVSAISGTGTGELLDAVCESLPEPPTMQEQITIADANKDKEDKPLPIQVAIVGRPNVGKSSLLNGLAGTPRSIVSDFSGTTRDTIDTDVIDKNHPDREFTLIDTAGIRRRTQIKRDSKSIKGEEKKFGLEQQSIGRALQAMKRADVVVLVIDATEGATQQDFVLAERAVQEGCALVLCCNKWDLVDKDTYTMNSYSDDLRSKLRVFEWANIIYTSALTGQRISKILDASYEASVIHKKRLTTATLNAVVQEATLWKAPPAKANKKGRIYYTTQAAIRPPTFVFFLQRPEAVLRHVQEVHGKAVEKKYWIRRDAYSLVVAREEQRRRSHQREKQHREGALKSPS